MTHPSGNKRQKVSEPESAKPASADHDMQGSHDTNAVTISSKDMRQAFAETVPLATGGADSASDYCTWSVQQLMKLYYGTTNS